MPGTSSLILTDRYRLGEVLGEGADTRIHRALDIATGRPVAIKVALSASAAESLRREYDSLRALRHPNLPEVHALEVGRADQRPYLARELVDGIPLDRYSRTAGEIDLMVILRQVARVLAFLHRKDVVHGDVKPANILVGELPEGGPWATLIDLGFSLDSGAGAGQVFRGTPFYSPARLLHGDARSAVDDVFALAKSFLELRAERDWGESLAALLVRACSEDPDLRPRDGQAFLELFDALQLPLPDGPTDLGPAPFVGRAEELATLRRFVVDKKVGLVTLEGVAGIGKSSLLRALGEELTADGILVLSLDCREAIQDPSERLARLLAFAPGITQAERDEFLMSNLQGHASEAHAPILEGPDSLPKRLAGTMGRFLVNLGRRGGAVLLLDEVRLGRLDDQGPLSILLKRLGTSPGIDGVTLILASRKGIREGQRGVRTRRLMLGELKPEEGLQLAQGFLEANRRGPEGWTLEARDLAQRIARTAGGHPGYQESIQRSLLLSGPGQGLDPERSLNVLVPDSFAGAIDARLDALRPDATLILGALSVLHGSTDVSVLVKLVDLPDARRRAALDELVRGGLVEYSRCSSTDEQGLAIGGREGFQVCSRVVASRVIERKGALSVRRLHGQVVEILARRSLGGAEPTEDIVFHALASKRVDLVVEHTPGAVRRMLQRGFPCRAADAAERGLDILAEGVAGSGEQVHRRALDAAYRRLHLLLADAQLAAGEIKKALESYAQAEQLELGAEDRLHARRKQSECHATLGDFKSAESCLEEIEGEILEAGSVRARALLASSRARLAYRRGQPAEATQLLRAGLESIQGASHDDVAADLWSNLGVVAFETGRVEEAEAWNLRALRTRERLGDVRGVSVSLVNLAAMRHYRGQLEEAQRGYERALEIKRRLGEPVAVGMALSNLGLVAQGMGHFEEALSFNEEALRLREEIGDESGRARSLERLAQLFLLKGRLGQAADLARKSIEAATACGARGSGLADALLTQAEIAIQTGRFDDARQVIERGLALCQEVGLPNEACLLEIRQAECSLLDDPGQASAARRMRAAIARLREGGNRIAVAKALSIRAELALDEEAFDDALFVAEELFRLGERSHNPVQVALGNYVMGVVRDREGEATVASELLHSARRDAERMGLPLLLWSTQAALASFHERRGRLRRAANWSLACVGTLRGELAQVGSREDEIAFIAHPRRARILAMLARQSKGSIA